MVSQVVQRQRLAQLGQPLVNNAEPLSCREQPLFITLISTVAASSLSQRSNCYCHTCCSVIASAATIRATVSRHASATISLLRHPFFITNPTLP